MGNLFDETVQVTGLTALQLNIGNESVTGEINAGWGGFPWGENYFWMVSLVMFF